MALNGFFTSIGLFQAPALTVGHRCMGVAALLGVCFVVTHLVTVVVTCVVSGFNWGVPAWVLDILGFLAGLFFAVQCWLSSNRTSTDFRSGNVWIGVWAFATLGRPNHRHAHAIRCGEMERGLCHTHGDSVVVERGERGRLWKRFHRYSSRGRADAAALPSGCEPSSRGMTGRG